jgi:hypothetical protein
MSCFITVLLEVSAAKLCRIYSIIGSLLMSPGGKSSGYCFGHCSSCCPRKVRLRTCISCDITGLSFPSISSVGPNGAIIHYRPTPETDRCASTRFFLRARECWPLLCLCFPFCIFERCLDLNRRAAIASRRATNLAIHLPTNLATHLPINLANHLPELSHQSP